MSAANPLNSKPKRKYVKGGQCADLKAYMNRYWHANKEKLVAQQAAWRDKNKDRVDHLRWKKEGRPFPTRPRPEVCECCGQPSDRKLHLDHCHETGQFRGWLCSACNCGIGHLGDSANGLILALHYLAKNSPKAD